MTKPNLGVSMWRDWSYADWNRRLLAHIFLATGSRLADPVERIPATPEELFLVASDPHVDPLAVADLFVTRVREELPRNKESFSGYCLNRRGGWNQDSKAYPHFFGMLWFTCLIAYGYPDTELSFYPRLHKALGKKDNLQLRSGDGYPSCLPQLWKELQGWTEACNKRGDSIRRLVLPSHVGRRTANGLSWFLAFPHKLDRLVLARCLWDAELVGPEPPIDPVVGILQERSAEFSPEFQEDLSDFVEGILKHAGEARTSAFWRAVRQEALHQSVTSDGTRTDIGATAGIVVFGGEEGLRPVLCVPGDWTVEGFERCELDEPVAPFTHFLRGKGGSLDEPAEHALIDHKFIGYAHKNLIRQGLLVLREAHCDVYRVVSGTEVNGATLALVRDELREPFRETFGGKVNRGLIDGWWEVTGCLIQRLKTLPPSMSGALQLLATMQPPTIGVAGGIRVPDGFFCFRNYLPHIHAHGAEAVTVEVEDRPRVLCSSTAEEGEWALPPSSIPPRGSIVVRAQWPEDGSSARTAEVTLTFVDVVLNDEFKPARAGAYLLEGCGQPEVEIRGGTPTPLDLVTDIESESCDLLELDGSVRYLGPGFGEMALQPTPGFDWMVVGPLNRPDKLVYVGDVDFPTPPALRRANSPRPRTLWKKAIGTEQRLVRLAPGRYRPLGEYPALKAMRDEYRHHADTVPENAPDCPSADLLALDRPEGAMPSATALEAIDALTAWSVRRGGLAYNDASVLVEPLVGSRKPLAVQQVLRAWAECGLLDLLRDSKSGRLLVVGRSPLLVRIKRGDEVEATVFGLMSTYRTGRLMEAVDASHGRVKRFEVPPPNECQPIVHRLRGLAHEVEEVARNAGIGTGGWLSWPVLTNPPEALTVSYRGLPSEPPAASYKLNAVWNWAKRVFERTDSTARANGVEVQRRTHNDGTSIYAVLQDGELFCWTYLRNWALLFGHELAGQPPFRRDIADTVLCEGMSPVHLPLPMARLCTLTGAGLPGPKFASGRVAAYVYPFGRRLYRLIEKVIRQDWLKSANPGV